MYLIAAETFFRETFKGGREPGKVSFNLPFDLVLHKYGLYRKKRKAFLLPAFLNALRIRNGYPQHLKPAADPDHRLFSGVI